MGQTDSNYRKNIDFWFEGASLTFRVSQSLFSSYQIDTGTQRLLKTVGTLDMETGKKILDLGCGYGPIGLTLAKRFPGNRVHLVDRDALAVDYTRQNTALNELDNCVAYGSLGYDNVVDHDFDLIISNLPGKAGEPVITALLENARYYLKPDGVVAVVVVTPLEELVATVLDKPGIEVVFHNVSKEHAIFHYKFVLALPAHAGKTGIEQGIYQRTGVTVSAAGLEIEMETAHGMPEFDSLDYQTDLVIKILGSQAPSSAKRVVVCNPGQGHLPAILWKLYQPECIVLVSRDLLSLHFSARNLRNNGCPDECIVKVHQSDWALRQINVTSPPGHDTQFSADCVVGVLRPDEDSVVSVENVKQAIDYVQIGGALYVAGGSTPITRLLKNLNPDKRLLLKKRRKHQGKSAVIFQRRS